jgi:hypothetical protein
MLLLDSGNSIKISLNIQSTPGTTYLVSVFSIQLKIYEATLCDEEHVFVTTWPPRLPSSTTSGSSRLAKVKILPLRTLADGVAILSPDITFEKITKRLTR